MTRPHTRDRQLPASKDLQKVPLLGLVSSSLAEVGLSKMASPSLHGQTLPRDGGFPDAAEAPDGGLEGTCIRKHGAKPRSFKVAPSVMPGRGSGAQVWSGATSAGLGMNRNVSRTSGEQLLLGGIPEVCPTPCELP